MLKEYHHPTLGALILDQDLNLWNGSFETGGRTIDLSIGGDFEPDLDLMNRATAIVSNFSNFQQMVTEFLRVNSEQFKDTPGLSEEINQLAIGQITLGTMRDINNGIVFFDIPDGHRFWRCDLIDGKLADLVNDG